MPFRRKLVLLYLVFCVGIGIVWLRAGQLQLLDGDAWAQAAKDKRRQRERLDAPRGSIVSADGLVLAEDVPIFQLTLIPWAWKHKVKEAWVRCERARCTACGAIYFPRRSGRLPTKCPCNRLLGRGANPTGGDAYPRPAEEIEGHLERLPIADITPLATALGLSAAGLEALADRRLAEIDRLVAAYEEELENADDELSFQADRIKMRRLELMLKPFVLVPDLPEEAVRLVKTNEAGRYRGFGVEAALRRRYPQGDLAAQLLGFTSQIASAKEFERLDRDHPELITHSTRIGRRGLERAYNWRLHGGPGYRIKELDASGLFSKIVEHKEPQPGRPARLSLDAKESRFAETRLEHWATPEKYGPKGRPSAGFVLMDADTGEILVWGEAPRFNLNTDLQTLYDQKHYRALPDKEEDLWIPPYALAPGMDLETWRAQLVKPVPLPMSRVSQVAVEPGSTFKPLIGLALLSSGLPLPFPMMDCHKGTHTKPHCHGCGVGVTLEMAITKSCNRWFALSLRDSLNWGTYRSFVPMFLHQLGIGDVPGRELPEWSRGTFLHAGAYDFSLDVALSNATARLEKTAAKRAEQAKQAQEAGKAPPAAALPVPALDLTILPGTPGTVGGDPEGLGRTLAEVAEWIVQRSGTARIAVTVSKERVEGSRILLKVGMRAARRPGWFALPGTADLGAAQLPPRLRGREAWQAGTNGRIERGGTVWFIGTFDRTLGRTSPEGVPVIRPDDGRNVGIGQGPVMMTPLQMVRAMAVLANGGTLVEPHLLHDLGTTERYSDEKTVPLNPQHLARIRAGMYGVANTPEGTADSKPQWWRVPARVYSKTGTAQVGGTWRPFAEDEDAGPWHHWFVGYAEAPGKRRVAFACVLHSRHEDAAGLTAAPAVQEILEHWYQSPSSNALPASGSAGR
jgi:cell division protein FtsI/penicillin-binding protein 2